MTNIELKLENGKVYYNGVSVRVNADKSGAYVDFSKNAEINELIQKLGKQKHYKIKHLQQGINILDLETLKPAKDTSNYNSDKYLTADEKQQIAELEQQIETIKQNARKRQPAKQKPISEMTIEELEQYIELKKAQLN